MRVNLIIAAMKIPMLKAGVALASLALLALAWAGYREHAAQKAAMQRYLPEQSLASLLTVPEDDNGELHQGVLEYCGQRIRVDWAEPRPVGTPAFPANGVKLRLKNVPSTDKSAVVMILDSVDRVQHRCLNDAVASSIDVTLECDPADAPVWSDFSTQAWRERTPHPEYGLIMLQGEPDYFSRNFNYIAADEAHYRPEGFPFQGRCTAEPGTRPDSERCEVSFKRGRMAVSYGYDATSLRSWREVDMLVRSTLDGQPATERCGPAPAAMP